jgi:hypothetical protein
MPRKKKSKYQSLVINKKRYYFYKIVWLDIVGDAGHADLEEFRKLIPAEMVSYGIFLVKIINVLGRLHPMITIMNHLVIEMFTRMGV